MKNTKYLLAVALLCGAFWGADVARGESVKTTAKISMATALPPAATSSRFATGAAAMVVLFLAGMMLRRQASGH